MGTRIRGGAAAALSLAVSGAVLAAEPPYPMSGRVYNTVENGWLTYECTPPERGLLTCSFVQTSFRQQLKPDEAAERLTEETKDLAASLAKNYKTTTAGIYDSPQWKELCALVEKIPAILDGKAPAHTPPEVLRNFNRSSAVQNKDTRTWAIAMGQSCAARNLDGMKRAIAQLLDQSERTCIVGTNPFTQTFKAQYAGNTFQAWIVSESTPQGDCGVINVSRLTPEITKAGEEPYFWRYYARKVITNPNADIVLMKCSDLDENEYLYDWREQSIPLQCDYIKAGL